MGTPFAKWDKQCGQAFPIVVSTFCATLGRNLVWRASSLKRLVRHMAKPSVAHNAKKYDICICRQVGGKGCKLMSQR